jgi:hypothetical protein
MFRLSLKVESVVCGSYRRGKAMSSDVDILLASTTATSTSSPTPSQTCSLILMKLIRSLQSTDFLTDHLALPQQQQLTAIFPVTHKTSPAKTTKGKSSPANTSGSPTQKKIDTMEDETKRASYMGICQLPSTSETPTLHRRIDLKVSDLLSLTILQIHLLFTNIVDVFTRAVTIRNLIFHW